MRNEFKNVTLKTGIANLPAIMEYNNKCVADEFDTIRDSGDRIVMDVSTDVVNARNSRIMNLTVDSLNITDSGGNVISIGQYVSNMVDSNQKVADVRNKSAVLEKVYSGSMPGSVSRSGIYGAASVQESGAVEYDMSSFFSSTIKGVVKGLSVSDLHHVVMFRMLDSLKIPLSVGSMVVGDKLRIMIYHDHLLVTPDKKRLERVYVAVVDGTDRDSVVQYAPAGTMTLS